MNRGKGLQRTVGLNRGTKGLSRGGGLKAGDGGMARGKGLPQRSERAKARLPDEKAWRASVFERDGYQCVAQFTWPEIACTDSIEAHHVVTRGWEPGRLDVDNGKTVCGGPGSHHDRITNPRPGDRDIAMDLGLWAPIPIYVQPT